MVTLRTKSLSYVTMSDIKIAYNPCGHSRTKYIDIQHHFLGDHAIKRDIVISHMRTNEQLADIFTKPVIPRSEIEGTKPPYVCPGCFIHTYSNNIINRFHVQ
jgi:predicted nucleotidyltransferase